MSSRPYLIRIAAVNNRQKMFNGVLRYCKEGSKIVLLKQFTNITLMEFDGTPALNKFLNEGKNSQWIVVKTDKPKSYYTPFVTLVCKDGQYYCMADIYASYETAVAKDGQCESFHGPSSLTMEGATKAFWHTWNHGTHGYKTEEGAAARLSRLQPNYKYMTIEVVE
jgi:hypothetical protein